MEQALNIISVANTDKWIVQPLTQYFIVQRKTGYKETLISNLITNAGHFKQPLTKEPQNKMAYYSGTSNLTDLSQPL